MNPYDPVLRDKLLKRIGDINDPATPCPLVTLEEFFEGNNDPGSIGYNILEPPTPSEFFELFTLIRNRPDVSTVLVEVMDVDEEFGGWPASETIWVITTSDASEVRKWIPQKFFPDEVLEGFESLGPKKEHFEIPQGMRAVGIWWD
ncbi:MAG TPA: hypothetical protein PKN33_14950 [Phycisphaerae bacterium]|nr:hypothetical protein [Phycisphaerae bacterium]